ncbi:hypothetical protein CFBP6626_21995 [Agrobacterium tumefaciens]|nr:hypothetical protein CFBP6626_21995 [Agrobacterium tumefaciens]
MRHYRHFGVRRRPARNAPADLPTPLIPVPVTGIQPTRVCVAGKSLFSPRTWADWIPVTSTGMRAAG